MDCKKSTFIQTWWNDNINTHFNQFKMWVGDENVSSKVYSRQYIYNKKYKSILDLGCAHATMYTGFKNEYYPITYTGVDSCDMFIRENNAKGITSINADVRKVPLPDSSNDIVFSRHIIEHQPEFQEYLNETIRLAKKEALHIFFKCPGEKEHILYDPVSNLYHNTYSRSAINTFLDSHPKVEKFFWVESLSNGSEDALHIIIKFE